MKNLKLLSLTVLAIVAFMISSCDPDEPEEVYVVPFTISDIVTDASGSANDNEIVTTFKVTNNTGEALTLRWVRDNVSFPTGWESAICDHLLCYDRELSENNLELDANATVEIKFNFYPESVDGTGTVDLEVYDPVNRTESTETISFSATARP
ncbi:MAG: hypothetical protein AB8G11_07045 [Saprospiraceae bacterium]